MIKIKDIYSDSKGFQKIVYSENDQYETEAYVSSRAKKSLDEGIKSGFWLLQIQSTVSGGMIRFIMLPEDVPEVKKALGVTDEQITGRQVINFD